MRPNNVLLFIVSVMGLLGVLCIVLPERLALHGKEVRWPTLAEVFHSSRPDTETAQAEEPEMPEVAEMLPDTTAVIEEPEPEEEIIIPMPKMPADSVDDSRIFLGLFYRSLAESGHRAVRIIHYGDSQIEEDRMTKEVRKKLQSLYGGSGVGLMPLAQTIPTLTALQELRMNGRYTPAAQGPQRYLVYGPKSMQRTDGLYGPMGQVAVMNDSLVKGSEDVTAICTPQPALPRYTEWRVFADSSVHYSFSGDTVRLAGRGAVYGLSQQNDTGVIVDNIPMRGCLGLVFTKMDSAQLSTFYREENVRLIILQFGGNAIPFNEKPGTVNAIVRGLREQVRYLQSCAPRASILFIGPSDMLRQTDGVWQTYPMVPYMDRMLQRMAMEENIAYFSLFQWMGGRGSMVRWREAGLAGHDGIHFTRAGARKAGEALAEWIIEGMEN